MNFYVLEDGKLEACRPDVGAIFMEEIGEDTTLRNELCGSLGFVAMDDVEGAYTVFRRVGPGLTDSAFGHAQYVWLVEHAEDHLDVVITTGGLPEYLTVLRMLEPLVNRRRALEAEIELELERRGR